MVDKEAVSWELSLWAGGGEVFGDGVKSRSWVGLGPAVGDVAFWCEHLAKSQHVPSTSVSLP